MDVTTVVAAAVGAGPALAAAWFAYKASIRATATTAETNRVAATKVDSEAYERSQRFYEKLLGEAERHIDRLRVQIDRLNDQVDKLNTQLASEQDVSNILRNQVRGLTTQLGSMGVTLDELRSQVQERSGRLTS